MIIAYADGIGTGRHGFQDGDSILFRVIERIIVRLSPTRKIRALKIIWPASMATVGGPLSWPDSARVGVEALDTLLRENPGEKFILVGYSGGCRVIHDWLDSRPEQLSRIAAVGLMSDPYRPKQRRQSGFPEPAGWGICGQRLGPIPDRTFWTTVPGDVISDAKGDALLRNPGDVANALPGSFLWELRDVIKRGDWQLAWQLEVFKRDPLAWFMGLGARLEQARWDVDGYLKGVHTTKYIESINGGPSLAVLLANTIAWAVEDRERKEKLGAL
jgi:pimeloyl-ACP methyl ester carboxylesterase